MDLDLKKHVFVEVLSLIDVSAHELLQINLTLDEGFLSLSALLLMLACFLVKDLAH